MATRIASDSELTIKQATDIIDVLIDEVTNALAGGEEVLITGFGKFVTMDKKSRPGRNPRTNAPLTIHARKVLKFRSSPLLTEELTKAVLNRRS